MDVDDLLRAEDFAAEARDAMFLELDDRTRAIYAKPWHVARASGLHVNDVGGADVVANPATRAA